MRIKSDLVSKAQEGTGNKFVLCHEINFNKLVKKMGTLDQLMHRKLRKGSLQHWAWYHVHHVGQTSGYKLKFFCDIATILRFRIGTFRDIATRLR